MSLQCPLIRPEEKEQDILTLLVDPSEHREQILDWICQRIKEKQQQQQLQQDEDDVDPSSVLPVMSMSMAGTEQHLNSLGIPNASGFFRGQMKKEEQQGTWQLLVKIFLLLLSAAATPPKQENHKVDDALIHDNPLARMNPSKEVDLKLIPRDLEKELRQKFKKVATPSDKKFLEIRTLLAQEVDRYDREIDDIRKSEAELSSSSSALFFDASASQERVQVLGQSLESSVALNLEFVTKFQRWIEQQKDLKLSLIHI